MIIQNSWVSNLDWKNVGVAFGVHSFKVLRHDPGGEIVPEAEKKGSSQEKMLGRKQVGRESLQKKN